MRFTLYWCGSFAFYSGIACLVCMAAMARQQEGVWRVVPLLLINAVVQPFCLLWLSLGICKVGYALVPRHVSADGLE